MFSLIFIDSSPYGPNERFWAVLPTGHLLLEEIRLEWGEEPVTTHDTIEEGIAMATNPSRKGGFGAPASGRLFIADLEEMLTTF